MAFQLQSGVITTFREEDTFGVLADNDSDALVFPTSPGNGMVLNKTPIPDPTVRADQQVRRPRHGPRTSTGSLSGVLAVGAFDPLFEGLMRNTWAAPLAIGPLSLDYNPVTGVATATGETFSADGMRVGDVVTLSGSAASDDKPGIVSAVGTDTFTIANKADWAAMTADTGVTVTRGKKLIMPAVPVPKSYSIEHWEAAAVSSARFLGCRVGSATFNQPAEGMVSVEFGFTGQNMALGSSQYFTSATTPTAPGLVAVDAIVSYNGAQVATMSAMSLALDLGLTTTPVIGSVLTPDVFGGVANPTASLTFLKEDQDVMSQFLGETTGLSLTVVYKDAAGDYFAVSIPSFTVGAVETQRIGPSGAQLETATLLIGVPTESNRDASMVTLHTSAA
jgi:hypothetical protein